MTVPEHSIRSRPRRGKWLTVPVVGLPLLLLLSGSVYSLSHLSVATEWMDHTNEVRIAIERLRSTAIDGETGMRGYLVAGEDVFLEPYTRAVSQWPAQFEQVQRLTTDNPLQQERLHRLAALIRERFDILARQRTLFDGGDHDAARLTPIMLNGKRVMDAVRGIIDDMQHEEGRLDVQRQSAALRRWQVTMVLFVGGAFATLVILGAALFQRRAADAQRERSAHVTRAIDGERRLLRAILTGMEDAITLQDQSGKLIFANPGAATLMGFPSLDALLAAKLSDVARRFQAFDEGGRSFSLEEAAARAVHAAGAKEVAVTIRSRVGQAAGEDQSDAPSQGRSDERWSNVRGYPIIDGEGQVVQVINVFRDVTFERRDDERRELLVRVSDELSATLDYEKTLAAVARAAVPPLGDWCAVDILEGDEVQRLATSGVPPAERRPAGGAGDGPNHAANTPTAGVDVIRAGRALFQPLEPGGRPSLISVPLIVGGRSVGALTLAMTESGRHYTPRDLAFAQSLADRAALAVENTRLFREAATAREKLAQQLSQEKQRRQDAEDTSRFAEMFVGMLGHDLRNPLNAVGMTARLLKRRGDGDPKAIDRIVSSVERMSHMVAQLLDLTRSRLAGGIPVERTVLRLGGVIAETLDELRLVHPEKAIRWNTLGEDELPGDRVRLSQVVSNLVGNAIEHGDAKTPVTVTLSNRGDRLALIVHNAGRPIPPPLLHAIFDPFRRTTARGELARGLGLGLFISQQIVLAHGGEIDVTSTAEEGTTFTVTLPRWNGQKFQLDDRNLVT
jgi:signal transduction histidine kinase